MISDPEHLPMCLLAICISWLVSILFCTWTPDTHADGYLCVWPENCSMMKDVCAGTSLFSSAVSAVCPSARVLREMLIPALSTMKWVSTGLLLAPPSQCQSFSQLKWSVVLMWPVLSDSSLHDTKVIKEFSFVQLDYLDYLCSFCSKWLRCDWTSVEHTWHDAGMETWGVVVPVCRMTESRHCTSRRFPLK